MTRPRPVPIKLRDRDAYPFMRGIVLAMPGVIVEDEASGARVRVREDGSLEALLPGGHPRPGAAHATCGRAP